jgi:hypothetical protein
MEAMKKLDVETVKAVELTAPGACEQDAVMLSRNLTKGLIFNGFNERERAHIRANILALSADRLIPSLHSFFEDINFIQGPAECVKRLVPRSLKNYFTNVNQDSRSCKVQVSASKFDIRPGTDVDRLDLGYRQTWIMAMREYRAIPSRGRKATGDRLAKATTNANEKTLCKFGALTYELGFESDQIRDLVQRSPDREIARSALLEARNQNEYRYDPATFERYVETIVGLFNTASKMSDDTNSTKELYRSDELPKRCGLPILQHHDADRKLLFIDRLHGDVERQGITSFFIRRSVYLAFFGLPATNVRAEETLYPPLLRKVSIEHKHHKAKEQLMEQEGFAQDQAEQQRLGQEQIMEEDQVIEEDQFIEEDQVIKEEQVMEEDQVIKEEQGIEEEQVMEQESFAQDQAKQQVTLNLLKGCPR